jgi:hypothetical protein
MAKHRSAGKIVAARAPLIWALRSGPLEVASTIPDPPPPTLKVERRGGSGITFSPVDPGALIWAVGEMRPRFRTPPLSLKVERQGGSGIHCVPLIRARGSISSDPAHRLPRAHVARDFG